MPIPAAIAQAILDTVIGRLVFLFLPAAGGDIAAARQAVSQMLAAHGPETADELALAAEVISLQFHSLEALSSAADPELSLNKILRLRGGAVSLSRESHKARRRLDQLRRTRATTQPAEAAAEAKPPAEQAQDQTAAARAQRSSVPTWSPALEKRLKAQILAGNLNKHRADHPNHTAGASTAGGAALTPVVALASSPGR